MKKGNGEKEFDHGIDPDDLATEWLEQPSKFFQAAKREAAAKRELALAHENVKVVRSQLIKEAASKKDLTNTQKVEAFYRDHKDHRAAKDRLIEAEYQANLATGDVFAMHQRKAALENAVKLAEMDMWSVPNDPRRPSREDQQQYKDEKLKTKIRRTEADLE